MVRSKIVHLLKLNVDAINFKNNGKNFKSNFKMIVSNSSDKNFPEGINVVFKDIEFNNKTNNYTLAVNGNFKITATPELSALADLEFKITNFDSLLATLNNEDSLFYYAFNRSTITNMEQVLNLISKNEKDTDNDRYYRVVLDFFSETAMVNGINHEQLIRFLLLLMKVDENLMKVDENKDEEEVE
jgi:hypothetical protein